MTEHKSPPGQPAISQNKPSATGKPRPIGWSVGHPWLKRYDEDAVRPAAREALPSKELIDELA